MSARILWFIQAILTGSQDHFGLTTNGTLLLTRSAVTGNPAKAFKQTDGNAPYRICRAGGSDQKRR
ncbi:hypothetical protein [Photobacterium arenosum]|uniref:hypothetical protein n=1 Tax=Photobacterium arenosum TaxID=2774143 RepID=UPI00288A0309|nr:hypothetical protein [Photobacterium arenosum]